MPINPHSLEDFYNTNRLAKWNRVNETVFIRSRTIGKDGVYSSIISNVLARVDIRAPQVFDVLGNILYSKFYDAVSEDVDQVYPGIISHVLDRLQFEEPIGARQWGSLDRLVLISKLHSLFEHTNGIGRNPVKDIELIYFHMYHGIQVHVERVVEPLHRNVMTAFRAYSIFTSPDVGVRGEDFYRVDEWSQELPHMIPQVVRILYE